MHPLNFGHYIFRRRNNSILNKRKRLTVRIASLKVNSRSDWLSKGRYTYSAWNCTYCWRESESKILKLKSFFELFLALVYRKIQVIIFWKQILIPVKHLPVFCRSCFLISERLKFSLRLRISVVDCWRYTLPQYQYRTSDTSFSTSLLRNSGQDLLNTIVLYSPSRFFCFWLKIVNFHAPLSPRGWN